MNLSSINPTNNQNIKFKGVSITENAIKRYSKEELAAVKDLSKLFD